MDLSLLQRVSFVFMMSNNDVQDVMDDIEDDDDLLDDEHVHVSRRKHLNCVFTIGFHFSL